MGQAQEGDQQFVRRPQSSDIEKHINTRRAGDAILFKFEVTRVTISRSSFKAFRIMHERKDVLKDVKKTCPVC